MSNLRDKIQNWLLKNGKTSTSDAQTISHSSSGVRGPQGIQGPPGIQGPQGSVGSQLRDLPSYQLYGVYFNPVSGELSYDHNKKETDG